MISCRRFLSKQSGSCAVKQKRQLKKGIRVIFFFAVFCSIILQIELFYTMKAEFALYEAMKEDSSKEEVHVLLKEMRCFPVRKDTVGKESFFFDNGYGGVRTYGGMRTHEGIDIMTSNNQPGYFQVQSVCDGVVEKIGWLKLGGYRIGIRGESGYYYYYAHLDHYAEGIAAGKKVSAGELIGYMGNTGYGKEGTKGKFAVHLHFGIYRPEKKSGEAMNPYYLLEYIEN